jgi:hypothetical protein
VAVWSAREGRVRLSERTLGALARYSPAASGASNSRSACQPNGRIRRESSEAYTSDMTDLISRATRRAFREAWVDTTLREIETDFDNAGIQLGSLAPGTTISGERRTLVEKYYSTVDWSSPRDTRKVLEAFEGLLGRIGYGREAVREQLIRLLGRDHFSYSDAKIQWDAHLPVGEVSEDVLGVDISQLRLNIDRIKAAIDQDPGLAIGSSKELVEATCKAILVDAGIAIPAAANLPQLVSLVAQHLDLLPANVPDSTQGAASIKRVLGSLANIVQGIAELRNLYGTGHGKAPGHATLTTRHARLCAGAASTLSTFLMEEASEKRGA